MSINIFYIFLIHAKHSFVGDGVLDVPLLWYVSYFFRTTNGRPYKINMSKKCRVGYIRPCTMICHEITDFPSVQEILNHIKFAVCSQKHIPRILQHRIHELVTLNSVGTFMRLVIKLYQCNYIRILIGKCEVDML